MGSISDPPFMEAYKTLLEKNEGTATAAVVVEECELPVIDVRELEREECKLQIARASEEWGFFQVVNHGISTHMLRTHQDNLFKQPFHIKTKQDHFSAGTYRWGSPTATSISQFSWSEAFHIPLSDIIIPSNTSTLSSIRILEEFASRVSRLAETLADILAEQIMGQKSSFFKENCLPNTCYLRLNRYPPCHVANNTTVIHGLMPHTDSDFLTILYQDEVGGLQLLKDSKWIAVKPNPQALIINIGDLFQAWSNGLYKSVEHRVVTNPKLERFSAAYFFCPSNETVIESSVYRKFSFQEYRQQVRDDVVTLGSKIGLPRFLLTTSTS